MNKKTSRARLRSLVERSLKTQIPEPYWQYAIEKCMVSEVEQDISKGATIAEKVDWLAGEVAKLLALTDNKPGSYIELRRRQRRGKRLPSRQEAIACYVAMRARGKDDVQSFRRTYLNDGLLQIKDIEPWIKRQHKSNPLRHAVIVRLPVGTALEFGLNGHPVITPPLTDVSQVEGIAPPTFLDYPGPGNEWVQHIPVGPDGTLGRLCKLAETLASTCGWQPAQATAFVLTNLTPEIQDFMVTLQIKSVGALGRIQLVVDPFFTPAEVAQRYGRIRAQMLSGRTKSSSEKHTRLAIHALEHASLDRSSFESWNTQYPKWAYTRLNRFKKEALTSQNRFESMISRGRISLGKSTARK